MKSEKLKVRNEENSPISAPRRALFQCFSMEFLQRKNSEAKIRQGRRILALSLFIVLLLLLPAFAFAGEITKGIFGLNDYVYNFIDNNAEVSAANRARIDNNYYRVIETPTIRQFREIEGVLTVLDTAIEWAFASFYSPALVKIRPPEAARLLPENDLNSPRKLATAVLHKMAEVKFLTPQDSAAIGRYESVISFIQDRHSLTRADLDTFFRNAIRQEVTAVIEKEFSSIVFSIRNTSGGRNGRLIYTPSTRVYVLSYGGFNADENLITAPAPGLPALLSELRRNRDFDEAGIRSVEENAATIPYIVYADRKARGEADALALITDAFVNFYTNSTVDGYNTLLGINARYALNGGYTSGFASGRAMTAYGHVLLAIFPDMGEQIDSITINSYMRDYSALQTYSRYLTDRKYEIFGR